VGKKSETAFVQKRQDLLQRFLNEALKHPILQNSEAINKFLTPPAKEWEIWIRTTPKTQFTKEVSDLRTIKGSADIRITEENMKYCEQLHPMVKVAKDKFRALQKYNNNIASGMEKLGINLTLAAEAYKILGTTLGSMGDRYQSTLLAFMHESHIKLAETYKAIKEVFIRDIKSFYRFYKYEMSGLEELIEIQKAEYEIMNALEKKLWNKKEIKFHQKNLAGWKLEESSLAFIERLLTDKAFAFQEMLPKETAEVRRTRMMCGYYINKVKEEFHRLIKKDRELTSKQFSLIPTLMIKNEEKIIEIWNELLNKIKSANAGRKRC